VGQRSRWQHHDAVAFVIFLGARGHAKVGALVFHCSQSTARVARHANTCHVHTTLAAIRDCCGFFTCTRPELRACADSCRGLQLEREIVEVLRSEIRSWRPRFPTQFLYELIGGLHPLLQRLEAMKASGTSQSLRPFDIGSEFLAVRSSVISVVMPCVREWMVVQCKELTRLSNDFYVHGFPVNLTFTDLDSLVQTVKKTVRVVVSLNHPTCLRIELLSTQNIHDIENPQTKFGLSALVYPYPNEVFSVWIFLVSLVPKHLRRRQ
jgi:hypothetical protein